MVLSGSVMEYEERSKDAADPTEVGESRKHPRIPFVILTGITIQLLCHVNIYIWGSGIENSVQWTWLWPREGSSVCEISSVLFRWNVRILFYCCVSETSNLMHSRNWTTIQSIKVFRISISAHGLLGPVWVSIALFIKINDIMILCIAFTVSWSHQRI